MALDQEAEGFNPEDDGTPLVPISADSVEAMQNDLFRKVLRGVGVVPPGDEQVCVLLLLTKELFSLVLLGKHFVFSSVGIAVATRVEPMVLNRACRMQL